MKFKHIEYFFIKIGGLKREQKRNPKLSFTIVHTLGYSTSRGYYLRTFLRFFFEH